MLNKLQIIQTMKDINFNKDNYWLVTGAAMVLYGIKEFTNDIDLGCTSNLSYNAILNYKKHNFMIKICSFR